MGSLEALSYDMSEFEADFAAPEVLPEGTITVLDVLGVEYDDLGQQEIATASGSGNTNGCDLDGE